MKINGKIRIVKVRVFIIHLKHLILCLAIMACGVSENDRPAVEEVNTSTLKPTEFVSPLPEKIANTLPAEAKENCLAGPYLKVTGAEGIRGIKICQNKIDKREFFVAFNTADEVNPVCFIPMTKYGDGNKEYIGEPLCLKQVTFADQQKGFRLLFNRSRQGKNMFGIDFKDLDFNSLFILKDIKRADTSTIKEFLCCMEANYNDTKNGRCSADEKDRVCSQFIAGFHGYYISGLDF